MKIDATLECMKWASRDWHDLLVNPGFLRVDSQIAWTNFSRYGHSKPRTPADLRVLHETGQYSFGFRDGSLAQVYYRFDPTADAVVEASLGFYRLLSAPRPPSDAEAGGGDLSATDDQVVPPSEDSGLVEWLRVDYDPTAASPIVHAACHVHICGLSGARVAINGVPNPRQFFEFIVATFYPEDYDRKRLGRLGGSARRVVPGPVNRDLFQIASAPSEIMHVHLPLSQ